MTGLDVERDNILEVAVGITNQDLSEEVIGPSLILRCDEESLESMSEFVKNMHTNSGLIEEVRRAKVGIEDAEDHIIQFLESNNVEKGILSGNSIHMDRLFLLKYMPRLFHKHIHPVCILDVSTLKQIFSSWDSNFQPLPKRLCHRSLDDIKESISEYSLYLTNYISSNINPS